MSAPGSAYFLIDHKFVGSNDVEMIVNPAKAQADLATLKARFYLDDVIGFKAVYGGVEYHGFWGLVVSSGFNYYHHKTSRILEINAPKAFNPTLRTLNDAGLNTMGNAVLSDFILDVGSFDYLSIVVDYLSAFYVDTDLYGITVDKYIHNMDGSVSSSTSYEKIAGTYLVKQASDTGTITLSSDLEIPFDKSSVELYVKGFIENAEGRFTTINRYYIVSDYNKANYDFDMSNLNNLQFTVTLDKPLKSNNKTFTTDIYIDYYDDNDDLQTYLYGDAYVTLTQGQTTGNVGVSLPPEIDPNKIDSATVDPQDDTFSEVTFYDQTV